MPYITQERREKIDPLISIVARELVVSRSYGGVVGIKKGELNYFLYALCKRHLVPSYVSYRNYIGEQNECVAEIRRTILAPYEEKKRKENGDIE